MKTARGTGMRVHKVHVRFGTPLPGRPADSKLGDRIVEVRKLLRTDLSLNEIAEILGVSMPCLRGFVKRRNICNLTDRRMFNTLQKSLAREEARQHSSDVEQPLCRRTRADSSPAAGTISLDNAAISQDQHGPINERGERQNKNNVAHHGSLA